LLRDYHPQAIELVGDLNSDLALDFLDRWPDPISLTAAKASTIKRFYHAHNLRHPELLDQRLAFISQAATLLGIAARTMATTRPRPDCTHKAIQSRPVKHPSPK
jgi:hypothetical protein